MARFIDMHKRPLLQALGKTVVLVLRDIAVRLVYQFEGPPQTAGPVHVRIDRRMIVQVLAVIDCGLLDFIDGVVDFVNGFLFLLAELPTRGTPLQLCPRISKIGKRAKICRMIFSGCRAGAYDCGTHRQYAHGQN